MYLKISWNNVKNNFKDFSIYFLTLMIAVALFYAFNSLGSQSAFQTATSDATKNLSRQLIVMMSFLSKIISVMLAFLIIYANNFLLKRRKKELGIYMILGMNSSKISIIFVTEIIIIGVVSFIVGIAVGSIVSQGISILALKMFAFDLTDYRFSFSLSSLVNTFISFSVIFIIVSIFNVLTIKKVKVIQLLNAGRENEKYKIKNKKSMLLIFCLGFSMLLFSAYLIYTKNGLKINSADFIFSAVLGTIGTLFIVNSFFTVVLVLMEKQKKWYFKNINIFLVRQITSKIQTNYATITIISLLLSITICIVSTGMGIVFTINDNSNEASPYDVSIYQLQQNTELIAGEKIDEYLLNKDININNFLQNTIEISLYEDKYLTYSDMINNSNNLWEIDRDLMDQPIPIMSITDYNKVLKSQGKAPIDLKNGTYILNCKYEGTIDLLNEFLDADGNITINGKALSPYESRAKTNIYYLSLVGKNDEGTIIVADELVQSLEKSYVILEGNIRDDIMPVDLDNMLLKLIGDPNSPYQFFTKSMMNVIYYGSVAMLAFICCYIGIIFLIICAAILSLQQLTDTVDSIYRYKILNNLGVTKEMCNQSILKQISIYFGMPLLLAIIYASVLLPKIISKVSNVLKLNIGTNVGITLMLFILVYGSYFIITYLSCRRIIMGKIITQEQ